MKEGSKVPRRGNVPKREILPDPVYNSVLVTKLINGVMLDGKKGVAQKVVYDAFDLIQKKLDRNPLEVFTEALNNIMPALEVKARRVGGATYQVPIEVRRQRDHGRREQHRRLRQEARGYAQDGRVQQGLRPLSLVISAKVEIYAQIIFT